MEESEIPAFLRSSETQEHLHDVAVYVSFGDCLSLLVDHSFRLGRGHRARSDVRYDADLMTDAQFDKVL